MRVLIQLVDATRETSRRGMHMLCKMECICVCARAGQPNLKIPAFGSPVRNYTSLIIKSNCFGRFLVLAKGGAL